MENLKRLRELQKKYFASRNREILIKSKTYEAVVDKMISQYFGSKNPLPFNDYDGKFTEEW